MASLVWPRCVLTPWEHTAELVQINADAGQRTLAGTERTVSTDLGLWRVALSRIPLFDHGKVGTWYAIDTLLEGRRNPVLAPIYVTGRIPFPAGVSTPWTIVPHDDDTLFSDGTGYAQPTVTVTVRSDAALGGTALAVDKIACGTLEPGHTFSIGERAYRIRRVTSQSATVATVEIRPRLREAVTAGTECNFVAPAVKARLADDDAMTITLEAWQRGFAAVSFVEDTL